MVQEQGLLFLQRIRVCLVPSTHMVPYNHRYLQYQEVWFHLWPLMAPDTYMEHIHDIWAEHSYTQKTNEMFKKGTNKG